jgi:hypothetical protein
VNDNPLGRYLANRRFAPSATARDKPRAS